MARHSWYPERNGRNSAPYKTPVDKVTNDLPEVEKGKGFYQSINVPGQKSPVIGSLSEKGKIRANVPLIVKKISYCERSGRRITIYRYIGSDNVWYEPNAYRDEQIKYCKIRKKTNPLDYMKNSFVYELAEREEKKPDMHRGKWIAKDRKRDRKRETNNEETEDEKLFIPINVASIDDIL